MKVTSYKDYLDKVYEEFDQVDKKSIDIIVRHGLVKMQMLASRGIDMMLRNDKEGLYYYVGDGYSDAPDYAKKLRRKAARKYRILHLFRKQPYSGYYYFGLSSEEYEKWTSGEPQEFVRFFRVVRESEFWRNRPHQFRIKMDDPFSWMVMIENPDISKAEYIKEIKRQYETTSD